MPNGNDAHPVFKKRETKGSELGIAKIKIDWPTTQNCRAAGHGHPNALKVRLPDGTLVDMNGVKIPDDEIQTIYQIIRDNGKQPAGIYLMPAVDPDELENEADDQAFTIIVGGYDTDNCLHTNSCRDFFDPCPTDCPNELCAIDYQDPPD